MLYTLEHYRVSFMRKDLGFIPMFYLADVAVVEDVSVDFHRTLLIKGTSSGLVLQQPMDLSKAELVGRSTICDRTRDLLKELRGEVRLSEFRGETRELIGVLSDNQPWYLKPIR